MALKKNQKIKVTIEPHSIFQRKDEKFLITEVDGEAVIMNTENGTYWGLNATTTEIWTLLKTPHTFKSILDKLLKEFDVTEDVCKVETMKVLLGLHRLGIISITTDSKTI